MNCWYRRARWPRRLVNQENRAPQGCQGYRGFLELLVRKAPLVLLEPPERPVLTERQGKTVLQAHRVHRGSPDRMGLPVLKEKLDLQGHRVSPVRRDPQVKTPLRRQHSQKRPRRPRRPLRRLSLF